jgi:hypothetical protein
MAKPKLAGFLEFLRKNVFKAGSLTAAPLIDYFGGLPLISNFYRPGFNALAEIAIIAGFLRVYSSKDKYLKIDNVTPRESLFTRKGRNALLFAMMFLSVCFILYQSIDRVLVVPDHIAPLITTFWLLSYLAIFYFLATSLAFFGLSAYLSDLG